MKGIAVTLLTLSTMASAEQASETYSTIQHWTVTKNPTTCNMTGTFIDDSMVGVIIDTDRQAYFMLGRDEWNIPAGKYSATIGIDDQTPWAAKMTVAPNPQQIMQVTVPMQFIHEVSFGTSISVVAGTWKSKFSLSHTKTAIEKTVECVKSLKDSSNPFTEPVSRTNLLLDT